MSEQDISNESVRGTCHVFITYSHDSPEHRHRVLALAERLRKDGVDAQLDQYVAGTPAKGWPRWMEDRLEWAQFVLVICTETYQRRFLGREEPDKGKGVDWEGSLITLEMYHARSDTSKFASSLQSRRDAIDGPQRQKAEGVDPTRSSSGLGSIDSSPTALAISVYS